MGQFAPSLQPSSTPPSLFHLIHLLSIMADRPKSVSENELQKQKESMKKAETKEMQRLPTADDIAQEKNKNNLNEQIQNLSKESLKKTVTDVKERLPTIEDIEAEKKDAAN